MQKQRKIEAEHDEEGKQNEEKDEINSFDQKRDDDEMEMADCDKIKSNLKNSSKVYYSITHTVQEEICE